MELSRPDGVIAVRRIQSQRNVGLGGRAKAMRTANCLTRKVGVRLVGNAVEDNAGTLGCAVAVPCDCAPEPERSVNFEQICTWRNPSGC